MPDDGALKDLSLEAVPVPFIGGTVHMKVLRCSWRHGGCWRGGRGGRIPFRKLIAQPTELLLQLIHQRFRLLCRAHNTRRDEHDQFRALIVLGSRAEQTTDERQFDRQRHSATCSRLRVSDQTT